MKFKLSALAGLVTYLVLPGVFGQETFDSDNDGFHDNIDNCTLTVNPNQRDTDNDGFGNFCDPDFNGDSVTNFIDLTSMKSVYFSSDPDADLNGDGGVNTVDLGILKSGFFEGPGPTGDHPTIDECNCAFSGDCPASNFCDYGPFSFTVEDNCWWRTPMPMGVPGAGCFMEYEGPWGPICDGYCTLSSIGSSFGVERADVLIASVGLWADALLRPSIAGGGPVDASTAGEAMNLDTLIVTPRWNSVCTWLTC